MSENFTDVLHEVKDKVDTLQDKVDAIHADVMKSYGVVDTGTDSILMWVAKSKFSSFIWAGYTFTAIALGVLGAKFFL